MVQLRRRMVAQLHNGAVHIGPRRGDGLIAALFELGPEVVPAGGGQPGAVNEQDSAGHVVPLRSCLRSVSGDELHLMHTSTLRPRPTWFGAPCPIIRNRCNQPGWAARAPLAR